MEAQQRLGNSDYYITDSGDVLSRKNGTCKKLKLSVNRGGYWIVILAIEGARKSYRIHRLVAEKFIKPIEGKEYVNHIDGNKLNNHVNNLEWVTSGENQKHAYIIGKKRKMNGAEHWRSKCIIQMDMNGFNLKEYDGLREASRLTGVSIAGISFAVNGIRKSSGGFKWAFK